MRTPLDLPYKLRPGSSHVGGLYGGTLRSTGGDSEVTGDDDSE